MTKWFLCVTERDRLHDSRSVASTEQSESKLLLNECCDWRSTWRRVARDDRLIRHWYVHGEIETVINCCYTRWGDVCHQASYETTVRRYRIIQCVSNEMTFNAFELPLVSNNKSKGTLAKSSRLRLFYIKTYAKIHSFTEKRCSKMLKLQKKKVAKNLKMHARHSYDRFQNCIKHRRWRTWLIATGITKWTGSILFAKLWMLTNFKIAISKSKTITSNIVHVSRFACTFILRNDSLQRLPVARWWLRLVILISMYASSAVNRMNCLLDSS